MIVAVWRKSHVIWANEFVKRGHTVSLVYSDDNICDFYFPISEKAKCVVL